MTPSRPIISAQVPERLLDTIDGVAASEGVARSVVLRSMIDMGLADPDSLSSTIAHWREKIGASNPRGERTEPRKVMVTNTHRDAIMSLREEKDWSIAEASSFLLREGLSRCDDVDLKPEQRPAGKPKTLYLNIPLEWIERLSKASVANETTRSALIRHLMENATRRWPEGPPEVRGEGTYWDCAVLVPRLLFDRIKVMAGDSSLSSVTHNLLGAELRRHKGEEIRISIPEAPTYSLPLRLTPSDLQRVKDATIPYNATFSSAVRWLLDAAVSQEDRSATQ